MKFYRRAFFTIALLTALSFAGCSTSRPSVETPAAAQSIPIIVTPPLLNPTVEATPPEITAWCQELEKSVRKFQWAIEPCKGLNWKMSGRSVQGRPLIYGEFGNPNSSNTTLVLTMVHSDEITPLYLGIQLAHWMKVHGDLLRDSRVVIAPLVNPDGFYVTPRSRMNAHGVDINRNFPTRDWQTHAIRAWKVQFKSNPRRFPGNTPSSEPETKFQEELIGLVRPQKILSVHAPLNFLDYDGPTVLSLARFPREYVRECLKLRTQLKAISGGFFPGSLGNFAGQEKGIPTLTLELPTANARLAEAYWKKFQSGIQTMIQFKVPEYAAQSAN